MTAFGKAPIVIFLPANNGAWPNVIIIVLGTNRVTLGGTVSVNVGYQYGNPAASTANLSLYIDGDFNPYNSNAREIHRATLPTTSLDQGAIVSVDLTPNATNANPGTFAVYARISDGVHSRYLYAPEVLTIDPPPAILQFNRTSYSVSESNGVAVMRITRVGDTTAAVTVDFSMSDVTALTAVDYTSQSGMVTFAPGQLTAKIRVPIIDDWLAEATESVLLTLSNPTGGAQLGQLATATLTIGDNDQGGTLYFTTNLFRVSETGGFAIIKVKRTGGAAGGVTVDYSTNDRSAIAGSDYVSTSGTLLFGPGQRARAFSIPIIADQSAETNEVLLLRLSNPTGGAILGIPRKATLEIIQAK